MRILLTSHTDPCRSGDPGCSSSASSSHPTLRAQFLTVRTNDLQLIYYDPSHSYIIPHLVRSFENSLRTHRRSSTTSPAEPVTVLLEDFDDYGYAGATSVPFNYLRLGIEPYRYDFDTAPTNERLSWVMNHELLHIVASDKPSRGDRFFRSLFGGKVSPSADHPVSMLYSYWTNPRKYSPRWYHEGMAVFMETWMAGGIGRALGGWDEMVFRTMIRDSSYIYDIVGLESEGTTVDFQVGANSYLYGTRFVSYCGLTYGPEKVLAWCSRSDSSSGGLQQCVRIAVRLRRSRMRGADGSRGNAGSNRSNLDSIQTVSGDAWTSALTTGARFALPCIL